MATEIVTAKAGTNHVDSEDIGALYAGGFGKGRYALDLGNGLKCSMRNANTLVIDTGGIMFDGRFVRVKTVESLTVTNGTQGQYRKDLAVLTYKRDASNNNIETVSWSVLRGTPASSESAAKAPTFTEGSILDGDATAVLAVAEVDLAGLTPSCKLLLPTVTSLASLGDSVSPGEWKVLHGKINENHLAYKICNGICHWSIDCGGDWAVNSVANSTVDVTAVPDEAIPSTNFASAACYPKDANVNGVLGVRIDCDVKKLQVRNASRTSTRYWSVDFCYPVQ